MRRWIAGALAGIGACALAVGCYRDNLPSHGGVTAMDVSHPYDLGADVLTILQRQGSDVTKPHSIDFYFYFKRRADAEQAAAALQARQFKVTVDTQPYYGQWLCLASRRLVPDRQLLAEWGRWFPQLASRHGGDYDGWEAAIER